MDISVAETIFITSLLIISIAITYYYVSSFTHYGKLARDVNIYRIRIALIRTIYSLMINMAERFSSKETAYLFFDDNVMLNTSYDNLIILYCSKMIEIRREELLEMANKIFSSQKTQVSFKGQAHSIVIEIELEKTQTKDGISLVITVR